MRPVRSLVLALTVVFAGQLASAQRPTAPTSYDVIVYNKSGRLFSNGSATLNFKANSFSRMRELKSHYQRLGFGVRIRENFGGSNYKPKPQRRPKATVANSSWTGTERLAGFGYLKIRFVGSNSVVLTDRKRTVTGKYFQSGNQVRIRLGGAYAGMTISGSVVGTSMSGTFRSRSGKTWSFRVSKR